MRSYITDRPSLKYRCGMNSHISICMYVLEYVFNKSDHYYIVTYQSFTVTEPLL